MSQQSLFQEVEYDFIDGSEICCENGENFFLVPLKEEQIINEWENGPITCPDAMARMSGKTLFYYERFHAAEKAALQRRINELEVEVDELKKGKK